MAEVSDTGFANRLVDDISKGVSYDEAGRVSFDGTILTNEREFLLFDLLQLHPEVPQQDASSIAHQALFAAASPPGLSLARFLDKASELEREYLSQPVARRVLLTQVSIDPRVELPRMACDGVTISFPADVPRRFLQARQKILNDAVHGLYVEPPAKYRWLRASVYGRSHIDAGEKALSAIEFRIGLLNLGLNRSKGARWSFGKRKPVNSIALAPIHSLHWPSGALATETWWYEPNYVTPLELENKKVFNGLAFAESALRLLVRLPYRSCFHDWIRYYGRALEQADWSVSFILLWQVLEAATGTTSAKYETTVRRASFLYGDFEYARRVLSNLRDCRNEIVHSQSDPADIETRLYVLKRFVEAVLVFHLQHAGSFDCLEHATLFLDLPANSADLERRLRLVQKAGKFRGLGRV